jgi:hypothetical protein
MMPQSANTKLDCVDVSVRNARMPIPRLARLLRSVTPLAAFDQVQAEPKADAAWLMTSGRIDSS